MYAGSEAPTKWIEFFGIIHILNFNGLSLFICVSFIVSHYLVSNLFFLTIFFCHIGLTVVIPPYIFGWFEAIQKAAGFIDGLIHFLKLNYTYLAANVIISYAKLVYTTIMVLQHKLHLVFGLQLTEIQTGLCATIDKWWLHWHYHIWFYVLIHLDFGCAFYSSCFFVGKMIAIYLNYRPLYS